MKLNKTILIGILFIMLSGVIFITDILNPIIRPVTYTFLMGSSKGKDIIFFGLLGLFLILSQVLEKEVDSKKYLKISIVLGSLLLVLGILIEILFRIQMGISLNSIFASMTNGMSTTSILHTHIFKSILGEFLNGAMGSFIQSDINTGVGLYSYVPDIAKLTVILIPVLFYTMALANQKRQWSTTFLLAFFSSCLIIGIIDGGLFGTPAIVGICGLFLIYRNGYYINYIIGHILKDKDFLEENEKNPPSFDRSVVNAKYIFNRLLVYIIVILIIALRFTVAFAGACDDYYTVEIANAADNLTFGEIPMEKINDTTYHVDHNYNEMKLLNDLKIPLNNSCEYYTVSWNIYSYL